MKKHTFTILSILLLFSCEREVDIELPAFEQKLVINSFLEKDSVVKISVAGTGSPFDETPKWIDDATVILFCGSNCDTLMRIDTGLYLSSFIATALQEYQIIVNDAGYPVASAKETVPSAINGFQISNLRDSVATDEEGSFYSEFTLSFIDNPNLDDYYEITVYNSCINFMHDTEFVDVSCFSNEPIISTSTQTDYYSSSLLFTDKLFTGNSQTLKINFFPVAYGTSNGLQGELVDPDYKLIVVLRSVSKSYYQYKKMLPEHLNAQEYDFWQGIGDPVQMFTNIEGGYGIFGAYSTVRDTLIH